MIQNLEKIINNDKRKERLFQLSNCPESHKNLHHPYSFSNRTPQVD